MKTRQLQRFSWLLLIYILLQPILDAITGWQVKLLPKFGLTIGVLVRAVVLLAVIYFIIFAAKENSNWLDRLVPWYLVTILILTVINVVVSKFNKPVFSIFTEGIGAFKSLNYLILLLGMYYALRNLQPAKVKDLVLSVVYWAMMIVNAVMVIAGLTHTGFNTYPQGKLGISGWFNAGNELGAILAISFPLVILYAFNRSQKTKRFWSFIGVFFTVASIILLGTKSCFYGMIITLFFAFIYLLFKLMQRQNKKIILTNLVLLLITVVGIVGIYPKSPVHGNSVIQSEIIRDNQSNKKRIMREKKEHKKMDHYEKFLMENKELSNPLLAKLLSGRTNYFRVNCEQYAKAPLVQKLFGMGVGGNYRNNPKNVEMDWFDLFFQFGIIGMIFTILPLVALMLYLLYGFVRYFNRPVIQDNFLGFISFGLGIFMSVLSGHVLNAPGVSIYFVLVGAYLVNQLENHSKTKKWII